MKIFTKTLVLLLFASLPLLGEAKTLASAKQSFKSRRVHLQDSVLVISIETNFNVPIVGKDIYWGRIYFRNSDPEIIAYRDELLAEQYYKAEKENSQNTIYYTPYRVEEINSPEALSLIEGAGAEVSLKSLNGYFNTIKGGRLSLKVKAPGENARTYHLDIVRNDNGVRCYIIHHGKRYIFDSLKVNADSNFLGATTILSGIQNIQFKYGGKVVLTINH